MQHTVGWGLEISKIGPPPSNFMFASMNNKIEKVHCRKTKIKSKA